jgi:hypothetical protein
MIIIDFSAIALATVFTAKGEDVYNEDLIRHQILNSLRMYNVKYREKYDRMIIACDGGSSWRKHVFAEYKAARKTNRDASPHDWVRIWNIIETVLNEIRANLPVYVVKVSCAEADDVIATLVETTQEFGKCEPVMIVSADKDFLQLQKYSNVSQFSPATKKILTEKKPHRFLLEQIFRGDGSDGVPNVLSPDNVFVRPDLRQTSLRANVIDGWIENYQRLDEVMDRETYRNFIRNRHCIDLSMIPTEITEQIIDEYSKQSPPPSSRVLSYLISKRCRQLINCVADFFPKKQ